jgi:hypothetical protein
VPGVDVFVIRHFGRRFDRGAAIYRQQHTNRTLSTSTNLKLQLRPAIKTRGVIMYADKITYLSYLRRRISPCCRLGNRGCNRAADSGSTACRVRSPRRRHSKRRSTHRRERSGVASSPSRETSAMRQRSLRTRSRSGSLSCSTSCVCFRILAQAPHNWRAPRATQGSSRSCAHKVIDCRPRHIRATNRQQRETKIATY